jgi:hypothetical protein
MYLQNKLLIKMKKYIFFAVLIIGNFTSPLFAQTTFTINALADFEYSKAGSKSHFYYNEIDQNNIDSRFSLGQLNLIGQIKFNSQWTFNTRLLVEKNKGQKFEKFAIPQLNIQWLSKKRKVGITIGSFTNPFGSYNQKQLSTERNFIGLPLAYSYYNNISDKIGFMEGMGDLNKNSIDGDVQWGSTNLYYGGYTTGTMFSWNIKPAKVNWKIALVNGASNLQKQITDPIHFGVISRLKLQPTYFWEQGFSVSHGTFFQVSEVSDQLENLRAFTQTVVGMDFKLGKGFFEFSGEVIGSFYKVPLFNAVDNAFEIGSYDAPQKLSNLSAYLDVKYEPSILQGSFIAYRIDHLRFGEVESAPVQNWDNNVLRHSIAIGYHINQYILARVGASTQQIENKEWDKKLGTFRAVITIHY